MVDDEVRRREASLGLREDASIITTPDVGRVVETAPVKEPETPGEWIKQNLFSSFFNSVLSIVAIGLLLFTVVKLIDFIFIGGEWQVIRIKMKAFMVGKFPIEEVWRVWTCFYLVTALTGFSLGTSRRRIVMTPRRAFVSALAGAAAIGIVWFTTTTTLVRLLSLLVPFLVVVGFLAGRAVGGKFRRPLLILWLALFPVMMVIIRGFDGVPPSLWGGFFFNLTAATVAIFASFPIGIALAAGRRSSLPAVRAICVGVIEIFRGVPLVAWLVFSKYVVDLMLPPQMDLPDIIKAFIAMTMFSGAYVAEIVRGGLQGVAEGQYEAARALGLSTTRTMVFIALPQALRATIPALISHFISLFKDTALFTAIEVTELLAAASRLGTEFQGLDAQTLTFAALLFWIVAFSMSRWSQRLEVRLGVGER